MDHHLWNLAAPITGVVLADYLVVRRGRLDVPSLYAPPGTEAWNGWISRRWWRSPRERSPTPAPDALVKVAWGAGLERATLLAARAAASKAREN